MSWIQLKNRMKHGLCFFLLISGITPLFLFLRCLKKNQVLVLLYHRVQETRNPFEAAVSPVEFDRQMRFLAKFFHVVSPSRLYEMLAKKETSGGPFAVITFDDGFRDNWENAHPILKRYDLPAIFFLAAASMDNREPMWTSSVEAMFKNTACSDFEITTASRMRRYSLSRRLDERMKVCHEIKREMKMLPDLERQKIFQELCVQLGYSIPLNSEVGPEMLSWNEARQMAQDPRVAFGCHSLTHRMLAKIPPEEISREIEASRHIIEEELGRPVHFFSYPGNSYSPEVKSMVRKAGYQAAFAVDQSWHSFDNDLYEIKRVNVENGPFWYFLAEISMALTAVRFFRKKPSMTKS